MYIISVRNNERKVNTKGKTMTTYKIIADGREVATMDADFARASSQISINGKATPFTSADANHSWVYAAKLALKWMQGDLPYNSIKVV